MIIERVVKMSEKRFIWKCDDENCQIYDTKKKKVYFNVEVVDLLNEQQAIITGLNEQIEQLHLAIDDLLSHTSCDEIKKENEQLRLELDTHKHPLWSTREAERKVNKLADSLADEVKKNGVLNEELNQLRIENMGLKKKGGDDDMTLNDDFIKGLEQLRKGLDSFKQNLELTVEQCNETLKKLKK